MGGAGGTFLGLAGGHATHTADPEGRRAWGASVSPDALPAPAWVGRILGHGEGLPRVSGETQVLRALRLE